MSGRTDVYLGSHTYVWAVEQYSTQTLQMEPADGTNGTTEITTLSSYFATTKDGDPIHVDLMKTLTHRSRGTYTATVDGDVMAAHLADHVGRELFEVLEDSAGNLPRTYRRVYVRAAREV